MKLFYSITEISKLLSEKEITLVDVRDKDSFVEGHIPGAVNIPEIFSYLSMSTEEGLAKIIKTFEPKFNAAGAFNSKPIVFYSDCLSAAYGAASRGYLLSRYLGHEDAGIYAGGLNEWLNFNKDLEFGDVEPLDGNFTVNINNNIYVTKEDVLNAIDDENIILLDDRDEEEWVGVSSSPYGKDFAPRKGRIKGAKWIAWNKFIFRTNNMVQFRSDKEIKNLCLNEGISQSNEIIIYCFKGSRASNTYLALKTAGFEKIKVYFASWNEWSRDPSLPIEQ